MLLRAIWRHRRGPGRGFPTGGGGSARRQRQRRRCGMMAAVVPPHELESTAMPTSRRVAVVVGSLRKDSFTRRLAKVLTAIAPAPLALEIVEIRELPLYNQDDDAAPPAPSVQFSERIGAPTPCCS